MTCVVDKVAFIHFAKAAGRYVNHYLINRVFYADSREPAEHKYKSYNSWRIGLRRDWTDEELFQLAANRHPMQRPTLDQVRAHHKRWGHDYLAKQYVHNHHHNWCVRTLDAFKRNGWFTFMFLRDPAEVLCSLWSWANQSVRDGADPAVVLRPEWLIWRSLDEFIQVFISDPRLSRFYALPDYVDEIDFVTQFTEENFHRFLDLYFDHEYRPSGAEDDDSFRSANPGYAAYRSRGDISDTTHDLLENSALVRAVRARL